MRPKVMRTATAGSIVAGFLAAGLFVGTPGCAVADGIESKPSVPAVQEDPMYAERVKQGAGSHLDGRWTLIREQRKGGWVVVHEHVSVPLAGS